MKRTLIGLMGLLVLTSTPAFARIRLQDNPGFITPVPSTQALPAAKKPSPTEYLDETSKQDIETSDDTASTLVGQTFAKFELDKKVDLNKKDVKKIVKPYLDKALTQDDVGAISKALLESASKAGLKDTHVKLLADPKQADHLLITLSAKKVGTLLIERDAKKRAHTWEFIIRRNFTSYIKSGDTFNLNEIKDAISISNQFNPYRITKVTFSDNAENNEQVDVKILVSEGNPIQISPTFDNQGRPGIGIYRTGITATNKNVFGLGDKLSSSNIFANGTTATINNYSVPFNGKGGEASFTYIRNHVDQEPKVRDQDGKTYVFAYGLSHPLNRSRTLAAAIRFNFRMNESFVDNKTDAKMKTYFLIPELNYNSSDKYGKTTAKAEFYIGRTIATHHKNLWRTSLTLNRTIKLPKQNNLILRGYAQLTSDTLPIAQELQMGGAYSVRGYTEGLIEGDKGYFFSAEDQFPIPYLRKASPWLSDRIRGAVFYDVGQTWHNRTSSRFIPGYSNKMQNTFLAAIGFGVRYRMTRFLTGFTDVGFGLVPRDHLEQGAHPTARIHFGIRSDLLPQ